MSVFVGCTIGPVFETIGLARKPLEIWMASYMYSRVAQLIIQKLNENSGIEIVSPYDSTKKFEGVIGAGTFSDHIIFRTEKSEDWAKSYLDAAIELMYAEVAKEITVTLKSGDSDSCTKYLKDKIYVLTVVKITNSTNDFPIQELVEELEKQDRFPPFLSREITSPTGSEKSDYLLRFIDHDKLKKSTWVNENNALQSKIYEGKRKIDDFESIANRSNKEDLLLNDYLAIVYSDGDSMGTINREYSKNELTECGGKKAHDSYFRVSEFITDRAKENIVDVCKYGAMPIYFGGDDMLFIAPICGNNPDNPCERIHVFELVKKLSKKFDEAWEKENFLKVYKNKKEIIPSLSFGIAISHYKYPWRNMRSDCLDALFGTAKNQEWSEKRSKKAVAIELRKHSGQKSGLILCGHESNKESKESAYSAVAAYIDDIVKKEESEVDESTINRSMHWKVMEQYPLIESMLKLSDDERTKRLKTWFVSNSSNQDDTGTDGFDLIISAMCEVVDSIGYSENNAERIKNTIDGIFRLAEFMCTKKK